ncbi:MAG: DnaB-like helicase N-terminal domain-containing protein [Corynebacterium sp.]|uniref:DnaB-like helicase N-terminal domain-containing protein n=1 Tax=Corynebacterium sp. TaxID=1720 RepID=UPI0026DEBC90|nr:DnaB-like helicase N-terminal domain-containing protein [Corynebacterium sp.]MDO5668607.1 DnaB-like helicase N-terminal domain-containing protein [Corynebacterium sp.]
MIDEEEIVDSPQLDPEALLLCGLMWAGREHPASDEVCQILQPGDFHDPHYGHLFGLIASRRHASKPVDPASLSSALSEMGEKAPLPRHTAKRLLLELTTLSVVPELVTDYADQVLGISYRRQYLAMGAALVHAGETRPESELFPTMVEHGRMQRAAWERRQALRERE